MEWSSCLCSAAVILYISIRLNQSCQGKDCLFWHLYGSTHSPASHTDWHGDEVDGVWMLTRISWQPSVSLQLNLSAYLGNYSNPRPARSPALPPLLPEGCCSSSLLVEMKPAHLKFSSETHPNGDRAPLCCWLNRIHHGTAEGAQLRVGNLEFL